MRPSWSGNLKLSLVVTPIKAYPAARQDKVALNLLHTKCRGRIKQKRTCPDCDVDLFSDDMFKAYQYEKDSYVEISPDEITSISTESSKVIDVVQFVKAREIDPLYYYGSHYLAPPTETTANTFNAIYQAVKRSRMVGIAKVTIQNKERLVAIRPVASKENVFLMSFLYYPDEVRAIDTIEDRPSDSRPDKEAMVLAQQLIKQYTKPFVIEEFSNEWNENFRNLVASKIKNKQGFSPDAIVDSGRKVTNLMDALKSSLERVANEEAA